MSVSISLKKSVAFDLRRCLTSAYQYPKNLVIFRNINAHSYEFSFCAVVYYRSEIKFQKLFITLLLAVRYNCTISVKRLMKHYIA